MSRQKRREFAWGVAWTVPVWIVALAALAVHS
jgi:hypothetical protein